MPYSYSNFDDAVRAHVLRTFPNISTPILDVGCGYGKYARLLPEYTNIEAVEVFEPYLKDPAYEVEKLYRRIHVADIVDLIDSLDCSQYKLAIFGDVLEHLSIENAQRVVRTFLAAGCRLIIVVPFLCGQSACLGNSHEEHLQPDLTPEVMASRYPELKLLGEDSIIGAYIS